jgi:hypothetical protein
VGSNAAAATSKDSSNGLSTGAIAGIAVGGVLFVIVIVAAAFALTKKKTNFSDVEGTMDQIYAARKSAEISRLSGGFTPHLVGQRPSISRASMGRNSMGDSRRQSFSAGNNMGASRGKMGYPAPRPSLSYNSPHDL